MNIQEGQILPGTLWSWFWPKLLDEDWPSFDDCLRLVFIIRFSIMVCTGKERFKNLTKNLSRILFTLQNYLILLLLEPKTNICI